MCGRFAFIYQHQDFIRQFGLRDVPVLTTSYNIGPDAEIPVILQSRKTNAIECHLLRWGFPGIEPGRLMNNARSETVHEKASFRDSFASKRCIIPASGFYEWNEDTRQPYYASPPNGYFGFAGLWTVTAPQQPGEPPGLRCTILTQEAVPPFTQMHHRFPVILSPAAYGDWLSRETPVTTLRAMVKTPPSDDTQIWPVSRDVNRMANNSPDLIIAATATSNTAFKVMADTLL